MKMAFRRIPHRTAPVTLFRLAVALALALVSSLRSAPIRALGVPPLIAEADAAILPDVPDAGSPAAGGTPAVDRLLSSAEARPAPPIQRGPTAFSADFLGDHRLILLDDGPASFDLRLKLIKRARSEVDLEYYEFAPDTAGRILLDALVAKKREMDRLHRPFRVRILLDHLYYVSKENRESQGIDPFMARELASHGIEVRYYHPAIWPPAVDQRDHRKLFVVDGGQFITGGRNITDEYFGFSPKADYEDSDVYVQGPAAGAAQGSFDAYWSSGASHVPVVPDPPWLEPPPGRRPPDVAGRARKAADYERALATAKRLLQTDPELEQARKRITRRGETGLQGSRIFDSGSVTFLSDLPGGGGKNRRVIPELLREASGARRSLILENWTFVPIEGEKRAFQEILARQVPTTLLTNSFDSSRADIADDVPIIFLSYPRQLRMARRGMRIFGYSGRPSTVDGLDTSTTRSAVWGIHTKRACIDHESCFIGSANLDERSREINSEIGVVVPHNPAFARAVEAGIRRRIRDAYAIDARGQYLACRDGRETVTGPSARDLANLGGIRHFFEELTIGQW